MATVDGFIRWFVEFADDYIRIGELVALLLAIVALVFARRQYMDSRDQQQGLEKVIASAGDHARALEAISERQDARFQDMLRRAELQTGKLEVLANALPTRFVGTFPGNLSDVTDLVRRTRTELIVLVDFCGYGYYSDPHGFKDYYESLRQLALSGKSLRMICYDRIAGREAVEFQFPRGAFEEEQRSEAFRHFYQECFPSLTQPATWDAFDEESWHYEADYRLNLQLVRAAVEETRSRLPFLAWIRDGDEAIASFQNLTKFGDFSFRTTDREFVKFFLAQVGEVPAAPYVSMGTPRPPLLASGGGGRSQAIASV